MVRICLLALIGLPAAGKSTLSHWLLTVPIPVRQFNIILLCYDDYLTTTEKGNFKMQRKDILRMLKTIVQSIKKQEISNTTYSELKASINENIQDYLIIADDNNYYTSMRYEFFQICRNEKISYAQIYLKCDLQLALERNAIRSGLFKIPDEVLKDMSDKLEIPNVLKNYWEGVTLVLNCQKTFSIDYKLILPFLRNAFNNIPKECIVDKSINFISIESEQHQLDLLLRHRIGAIIKSTKSISATDKKMKAFELNEKRKQILINFKSSRVNKIDESNDFDYYIKLLN